MFMVKNQATQRKAPAQTPYKLQRIFFAMCMVLGPLLVSLLLTVPTLSMGVIGMGTLTLFLLIFGVLGMTQLAMPRTPWLATLGGLLSLVGFLGYALIVMWQLELSYHSTLLGGGQLLATLYNQINNDPVQIILLLVFIPGHLFGPMLLGIALVRAKLVPAWVMWVLIIRVPLQAAGFKLNIGLTMEIYTYALLCLASIPIALALLKSRDEAFPTRVEATAS
jgi:hypothetical protein